MTCVKTVSYSFLLNGSPQGKVIPSRGLRQGDPLSPYLFILCTEVLSDLCTKAQVNGSLPGIRVARASPLVNHLLFADDTMFFCKSSPTCCSALLSIFASYEKVSGQMINLSKSSITFSSKTPPECKLRVKETLHISNEGGIGKYLGLPEHFGRKKEISLRLLSTKFVNGLIVGPHVFSPTPGNKFF
ncbi:putative RNA-directed DNA polymerase [Arabidopsis thaliana]